jgi:hypothetical protein
MTVEFIPVFCFPLGGWDTSESEQHQNDHVEVSGTGVHMSTSRYGMQSYVAPKKYSKPFSVFIADSIFVLRLGRRVALHYVTQWRCYS